MTIEMVIVLTYFLIFSSFIAIMSTIVLCTDIYVLARRTKLLRRNVDRLERFAFAIKKE